jgi:hypothetical protein
MRGRPLDVIRSTEVRSVFKRALKPELKRLGFKLANTYDRPGGWARDVPPVRDAFWIQFSSYGFFRDIGGEFIVEFVFHNSDRNTHIADRMWRLLDEASRQEAVRLINNSIAVLPGPLPELYGVLPESLRETHMGNFEPLTTMPPANDDVWFRYATRTDVDAWAEFLASRIGRVVETNEERLRTMPENSTIFAGLIRTEGEEKWRHLDP